MTALGRDPGARGSRGPRTAAIALVAVVLACLVGALAPAVGVIPAGVARAAATDLTLVTDAGYTVLPAERRIAVGVAITVRNNLRDTKTVRYYFDRANLSVPPGASGFKVTGAKGAKVSVAGRTKAATLLRLDLGARLYAGKQLKLSLTFDLRDPGGAADRQLRVGSSLVALPVWAFASTGATGSRVSVAFPAGYDVTVESGRLTRRPPAAGGAVVLESGPLAKPLEFVAYVVARRPPVYADSPLSVTIGGRTARLTLQAWADDPDWPKRVGAELTKALPVLADEIGVPWGRTVPLAVRETVPRSTGSYAGLFDTEANRVDVAYWADNHVVRHEAAHAWFNGNLLADRWPNEGFASLYAERAAAALGEPASAPELTDALQAARVPLNAWGPGAAPDATTEAYGYAGSLALARAIAERAGDDALRAVWTDASAGVGAYQPVAAAGAAPSGATESGATGPDATGPAVETVAGAPDWRSLLDLLEAHTKRDFTDLWRTWVVREGDAPLLEARAAARTSYSRTLALTNGWAVPRVVRDALRAWDFATAERVMTDARTVLAQRTAVEARAARAGVTLPDTMRRQFEGGQLADASKTAADQLNGLASLDAAAAARPSDSDPLVRLGLVGATPDADFTAARRALESGDVAASQAAADRAFHGWDVAWQEGRRRSLIAIAVVAGALVLAFAVVGMLVRWRRRRRAGAAEPA